MLSVTLDPEPQNLSFVNNTGALDQEFAGELLERAGQEASTGSLTLADLSDLMSALGSSG